VTIYYVKNGGSDAADGLSDANAWETITKVNAGSYSAGDSILFKCGSSWTGTVTIPTQGSSGNNITLGSYSTGAKPIIAGANNNPAITVTAANRGYWTIDGIDLRSSGIVFDAQSAAIYFNYWPSEMGAVPGWIIQNCTFNAPIHVSGPTILIKDNVFDGTGNSTAKLGAICIRGPNGDGAIIEGNTVSNFIDRGIWIYLGAPNVIVRSNVCFDIPAGASNEGVGINLDGFQEAVVDGEVYGNECYDCAFAGITHENATGASTHGNLVHDCDDYGISIISYGAYRSAASNISIHYNVIYNTNIGMPLFDSNTISDLNNVIYGDVGATTSGFKVVGTSTYVSAITFANNIIAGGWDYPLNVPDNASIWTQLDYDDIVPAGALVMIQIVGGNKTLADLQGMGYMTNGFTDDPAFLSAAGHDFHLQSDSPCIETGTPIAALTLDFDGHPLGRGANPDVGAFETLKGGPRDL
jgi:hypothetical protein